MSAAFLVFAILTQAMADENRAVSTLYLHGKKGTKVAVRVKQSLRASPLTTVPKHGKGGWKGVISGENELVVGGGLYSYLYFDYSFEVPNLQDQEGFCANAEKLLPRLLEALKSVDFSETEQRDFKEYWALKAPKADEYCVYPQDERTLSRVAPLEISPTPARITRLNFVVVPRKTMASHGPFGFAPKTEWKLTKEREPASNDALVVREWGVSFLGGEE